MKSSILPPSSPLRILGAGLGFLAIAAAVTLRPPAAGGAPTTGPQHIMLLMEDGVRLSTDIYLPQGPGPFPTIVIRTTYDPHMPAAAAGALQGYALVVQSTRGRFGSEGANLPFAFDGWADSHRDGYDTLEWIARQPWCNGKIGTWGGSALGITQLQLDGSGTHRVTSQMIQVAIPNLYEGIYRGGALRKAMIEDWLRLTLFDPKALGIWNAHPTYDTYWKDRDLTTRWTNVNWPAVHVGGWYDIFTQGTIDSFTGFQTKAGPGARGKQKLVMGPWTHGIFQDAAGDLHYPGGSTPPTPLKDPWPWFDFTLKGIQNGIDRAPAVTYYLMGDSTAPGAPGNVWRTSDRWPPAGSVPTPYYLHPDHTLTSHKEDAGSSVRYSDDPGDPVPTIGGPQLTLPPGPKDQRKIEGRPDLLLFTGPVLTRPLEITGRVRARLWAASDAPDTDFIARLCDVYPDGRSMNICEGILRARYRESFAHPAWLTPGKFYPLDLDLWSTSIVLSPGHRLRLQVTSSSSPGLAVNPNTGPETTAPPRIAHNTISLDGTHPSYVLLPNRWWGPRRGT